MLIRVAFGLFCPSFLFPSPVLFPAYLTHPKVPPCLLFHLPPGSCYVAALSHSHSSISSLQHGSYVCHYGTCSTHLFPASSNVLIPYLWHWITILSCSNSAKECAEHHYGWPTETEETCGGILKHQRRLLHPTEQMIVTILTTLLQLSVCSQAIIKRWTKERASGRGGIVMQMHDSLRREWHPKEAVNQSCGAPTTCLKCLYA